MIHGPSNVKHATVARNIHNTDEFHSHICSKLHLLLKTVRHFTLGSNMRNEKYLN